MLERGVANEVLLAMSARGTRLLRNNTGSAWRGKVTKLADGSVLIREPHLINFGLCKGGSDYIGWHPVVITEDMIGRVIGCFTAVETKRTAGGRTADDQKHFINQVRLAGGMAGIVNSVEAALELYNQLPRGL